LQKFPVDINTVQKSKAFSWRPKWHRSKTTYLIRLTTCSTWCSLKTNMTKIFCKIISQIIK